MSRMGMGLVLLTISMCLLVGIGTGIFIDRAWPLIQDKVHEKRVAYYSQLSREAETWFTIKLETQDIFAATNPLSVSVHTAACDPKIRGIQLTFEGASSYFPGDYDFSDPSFFQKDFEKLRKSIESNILILERNSLTTFAGTVKNLTYGGGGEFDIGITITYQDGKVKGYGMGETNYALKNAIRISPPEVLLQLRSSRLTTGLTYTAISMTFIAIGLTGLVNLSIKTFLG